MNGPEEIAELTMDHAGDVVRAAVKGELDMSNARSIGDRLHEAARGVQSLILDLSGLLFLDSSALAVLTDLHHARRADGGNLQIATGHDSVAARIFQLTGLDQTLNVSPQANAPHA